MKLKKMTKPVDAQTAPTPSTGVVVGARTTWDAEENVKDPGKINQKTKCITPRYVNLSARHWTGQFRPCPGKHH